MSPPNSFMNFAGFLDEIRSDSDVIIKDFREETYDSKRINQPDDPAVKA